MSRLIAALVVAGIALGFAGCDEDEPVSTTEDVASAPPSPSSDPPIEVGGSPVAIAADETGVWVADNSGGQLLRIDPQRPASKPDRSRIAGGPASVAIGEGAVWVASGDGTITRVDPASGETESLDLRVTQPGGIAAGEGSVWVASSAADQLVRIDPASGETVGEPIDVGAFPTDVVVGDGSVWVANTADGTVSRIDVASGQADEPIAVAEEEVFALAVGEGAVWAAKSEDRFGDLIEVVRIDPATSEVGDPAQVDAGVPVRLAAGEGGVWTTLIGTVGLGDQAPEEPAVALIDPIDGEATAKTVSVGVRPSGIATGAGAVWVANAGDGTVTRIDPGAGG